MGGTSFVYFTKEFCLTQLCCRKVRTYFLHFLFCFKIYIIKELWLSQCKKKFQSSFEDFVKQTWFHKSIPKSEDVLKCPKLQHIETAMDRSTGTHSSRITSSSSSHSGSNSNFQQNTNTNTYQKQTGVYNRNSNNYDPDDQFREMAQAKTSSVSEIGQAPFPEPPSFCRP